jgi:LacI family xylobiose transport system transcriptional regulator
VTGPAPAIEVVFYGLEGELTTYILDGVARVARQHDLAVVFTEALSTADGGRSWAEQLLGRHPLGVIAVHSHFTPQQHAQLAVSGIPVVALDPMGEPTHQTPSVGATNWNGGVQAARHLLELGHRRLGHITAPASNAAAGLRLRGVRDALRAARLDAEALPVAEGDGHVAGGDSAVAPLLAEGVTAIVCYNDLTAIGALRALGTAGRRVPKDVSVLGFDDIEMAAWTDPPLTTVRQPVGEMGRLAVEWVADALARPGAPEEPMALHLEPALIIRRSTAPPPA